MTNLRLAARGEATTTYTATTATTSDWTTVLSKPGAPTATLTGNVSIDTGTVGSGAAESLEWTITSAASAATAIRAVDLGFGFVGLSVVGAEHYTTHQSKSWCPPGTGCQEWEGGSATCIVGERCTADTLASSHRMMAQLGQVHVAPGQRGVGARWSPPDPVPAAFAELTKPGRSAFTGGSAPGSQAGVGAGYSGWSSQPALPFQSFAQYHEGGTLAGFASGSARINTQLRCGSVLPVTLKWGLFGDISADGGVNVDDAVLYTRTQYNGVDIIFGFDIILAPGSPFRVHHRCSSRAPGT